MVFFFLSLHMQKGQGIALTSYKGTSPAHEGSASNDLSISQRPRFQIFSHSGDYVLAYKLGIDTNVQLVPFTFLVADVDSGLGPKLRCQLVYLHVVTPHELCFLTAWQS